MFMKNINLTLNKKYKNYNMFIKKYLKQENIYDLLKINDFESNMVEKDILLLAEKINKHKIDLILNSNGIKNVEINETEIFNLLNKMKIFNETYFSENTNYKLNNDNNIYNYFNNILTENKNNINEGHLNCDDLLSCFYFYDILKTLYLNPNESFKLNSFSVKEKPIETMKNMIYGRGFENLNKTLLNNVKNFRLSKAPSLNDWNNQIALKTYNHLVEKKEININFNDWNKNNTSTFIPSVDLIGEKFKKKIYVENKNFTIFNNELNIKFSYSSNKLMDKFKKLGTLENFDNGRFVFYNITTYNVEKKDVQTFLIPIEAYKKDLHSKINKSLISKLKTEIKNKRQYSYNIPLEISKNTNNGKIDVNLNIEVMFNHLPNTKDIDNEHYGFNIRFKNSEDFLKLFDEYNLDSDFNLKNNLTKQKDYNHLSYNR